MSFLLSFLNSKAFRLYLLSYVPFSIVWNTISLLEAFPYCQSVLCCLPRTSYHSLIIMFLVVCLLRLLSGDKHFCTFVLSQQTWSYRSINQSVIMVLYTCRHRNVLAERKNDWSFSICNYPKKRKDKTYEAYNDDNGVNIRQDKGIVRTAAFEVCFALGVKWAAATAVTHAALIWTTLVEVRVRVGVSALSNTSSSSSTK